MKTARRRLRGEAAAEVYSLGVIVPEIEDTADNTTRFLVIGRKLFSASGQDKTTLLVSAGDTQSPGALHRLLGPLAANSITMTRIESRPSRKRKWDYVFFIDVVGHAEQPPLSTALEELRQASTLFRVLRLVSGGGAVTLESGYAARPEPAPPAQLPRNEP